MIVSMKNKLVLKLIKLKESRKKKKENGLEKDKNILMNLGMTIFIMRKIEMFYE